MKPELLFTPADILLPKNVDMRKWSAIACDQYTSQPEYWEKMKDYVGEAPSALHLIFPEVYLGRDDEKRISKINKMMASYLQENIFQVYPNSFFYVERTLLDGSIRRGLIGKIDLMEYDYSAKSSSPIRPTEGTVESRIPIRVRIREHALLELPHVLALIDDPGKTVIEPISAQSDTYQTLYDFDLWNGGHILGKWIPSEKTPPICAALTNLFVKCSSPKDVAIPVGDGNHSLATAKACFEKLRLTFPENQWKTHPARWALVELLNLRDDALKFEPVHRIIFHTDTTALLNDLRQTFPDNGNSTPLQCIVQGKEQTVDLGLPSSLLPVGPLQKFLDAWLSAHSGVLDYIHDDEALKELASQPGAAGILLPPMDKGALVPTVRQEGALPRKTFSLGHSCEKRYYLEARKIF